MAGPFKMKAGKEGPMKKNYPSAFKKDKQDKGSGYSSASSKLAGLKIPREEYNKTRNWHMMEDGPAKDHYKKKNENLTEEDHKRFSKPAKYDQ